MTSHVSDPSTPDPTQGGVRPSRLPRAMVVALLVVLGGLRAVSDHRSLKRAHAAEGQLRYHVPVGQDAAAVLATVRVAGFSATVEMAGEHEDIVIACNPDRDRESIRHLLAKAPVDMAGHPFDPPPVVFADE